jgi:hypothetical protein
MCFCIGNVGEQVPLCLTHGSVIRAVGVCEDLIQQLTKHLKGQPTNQRSESGVLRQGASLRPSICIAIPALTVSLDSVATYNYNRDCAYANDFPSRLRTPT